MLRMKQLPSSLIEEAVLHLDKEEYHSALSVLLQKKKDGIKARNAYERNGKLIRFALGRGYEMNDILNCLKEMGCDDEYME